MREQMPATALSERQRRLLELMRRQEARQEASSTAASIPPRDPTAPALLSFAQQRLWFIQQFQPGTAAYNIPSGVRIRGPLDVALFSASLRATVRRHEVLRTTFALVDGVPVQRVAPPATAGTEAIPLFDLAALPGDHAEREAQRLVNGLARQPFDLEAAPPWRTVLVRLTPEDHVFLAVMHHIISDTWTTGVFFREMVGHYRAWVEGRAPSPPPLPVQYADYAQWQRRQLHENELRRQLDYWRQKFSDAPALLELPTDRPRPAVPSFRGGRVTLLLPNTLGDPLKALSLEGNATLFMVLVASYQLLLARYTGQDDILVGTPMANRSRVELESLIGVFVNTLVLRTDLAGRPSFRELLAAVRSTTLEGLAHHDVPFERVVEDLGLERDTSRNPLFQALFAFQNVPIPKLVAEGLTLERFEFQETTARLDIELDLQQMPYGFVGWIGYSADLFEPTSAERMTRNFLILLEGIAEAPERPIPDLPLLAAAERAQLLTAWNDTATPYATGITLHALVERQVERTPEAPAVMAGGQSLTYLELNRRANQLARHLLRLGVSPGEKVGVYLERAADNAVALLGVLKSGAAYVPIDVAWPAARLDAILEQAGVTRMVTHRSRLETVAGLTAPLDHVTCLDLADEGEATVAPAGAFRLWGTDHLAAQSGENLSLEVDAGALAYVIFTSGSTGTPKGVVVQHRPVINLIEWVNRTFAVEPGDRLLLVSALTFDLSVYDLFGILAAGGTVRIATEPEVRDGQALARVLCSEPITFWDSAPAALQQLIPFLPAEPVAGAPLRLVFQSGDWIPVTLPDRLRAAFPGARVIGLGGATEATVWSNWFPIAEVPAEWTSIPYGRPIQNARYHVLTAEVEPAPIGVAGDLYITGECLAAGYLGDPILTSRKFLPSPFAGRESAAAAGGARLYSTGDRARYRRDGNLEFLGRRDHQVKVRGYRIELGEIETALARHPAVREAVVAVRKAEEGGGDGRRLIAYVVTQPGASLNVSEMRAHLQQSLPEYMIPAALVPLESLPVTANGKLDRKALPAPSGERPQLRDAFVEAQGEMERRIAQVWCEVLRVDKVGRHDNFFELGGHSMLLAQAHRDLQEGSPELTLVDLFTYPTVASLAARLSGQGQRSAAQDATARATARRTAAASSDIAIIGMALRFPGATTPERFWENLENGIESISFFSRDDVLAAGVAPELVDNPDYVRAEGDIADVDLFDPEFFGLRNLAEVEMLDPQQRIFLECAWEALERAGYDPETYPGEIGIFGGVNISSYLFSSLYDYDPLNVMSSFLTRIGLLVGNQNDYLCTRVAYHLNLRGPSITVQTACSTATVGAHLACQSLLRHECDMCLAGGAQIRVPQGMGYLYQEGGFPSPDGHCRSFDARAQGNVHGNGAGVLLLKRLDDALRDGDHVHAVIKGSAIANDGSAKVGFTAPGVHGQAKVAAEALAMAGVTADSIGYLEATGTATELGDPLEIAALTSAYRLGSQRRGYCPIGSVKSNIGHLDAASGVAAVIKTVLALECEKIPASLHLEQPNPRIDFASSPFFVNAELRPWPRGESPRRAAVHTYAVGGTNSHIILEEAPPTTPAGASRAWQLLPLSARTSTALHAATENLARHLAGAAVSAPALPSALPDIAYTLQIGRREFAFRRVALCRDGEAAVAALTHLDPARVWSAQAQQEAPAVAFLFAGDGSGLAEASDLYAAEPTFRAEVDRCAEFLAPLLGRDLREELGSDRPADPAIAEPLRFVVGIALARLWMEWGVEPRAVFGVGVGEYVAACVAEALSLEDALALATARGRLLATLTPGARLIAWASPEELRPALSGSLALEAQLEPEACLVRGAEAGIDRLQETLNESGVDCLHLGPAALWPASAGEAPPGGRQESLAAFTAVAARAVLRPPRIAWLASLTGEPFDTPAVSASYWLEALAGMVRPDRALERLLDEPGRVLLSAGPAGSLGEAAARLGRAAGRLVLLPGLGEGGEEGTDGLPVPARLLAALGRLWLTGAKIAWPAFSRHEQRRRVPLPTYPFERRRIWAEPKVERAVALGRAAPADRDLALDQWFYAPSWQRSEQPGSRQPAAETVRSWVLLSDRQGLGERLARRLRNRGDEVFLVFPGASYAAAAGEFQLDPRRAEDFTALTRDGLRAGGLPQTVVHLWGIAAGVDAAGEDVLGARSPAQELCFWSLRHLARAWEEMSMADTVEIAVVTAGAQEVTGEEELRPSQAASLALARVIPHECPSLRCRTIDIEWPRTGERGLDELSARLEAELTRDVAGGDPEPVVALRGRRRWVQRFTRLALPALPVDGGAPTLRHRGVYLIASELFSHGLLAASCLSEVQARLVLIGDSGLPAPETWDDWLADPGRDDEITATLTELRRLESLGCELLLCEADMANPAQVLAAVERAMARFGTLHGVFYLPVEAPPELTRTLDQLDPDFYDYRLRVRLAGLAAIEEAVRGRSVELFILGAGPASLLGGRGLALEALADCTLDLVARRESRRGSALWRSVGGDLFTTAATAEPRPAIPRRERIAALARALAAGEPGELAQIVVSTRELQTRVELAAQTREAGAGASGGADRAAGRPVIRERPHLSTPYLSPRNDTERQVAQILADVLEIEAVGVRDDFFELGGSSLVATQAVARLRSAFGVSLALADFFTGANVEAVAERVSLARWALSGATASEMPGEPAATLAEEELGFI